MLLHHFDERGFDELEGESESTLEASVVNWSRIRLSYSDHTGDKVKNWLQERWRSWRVARAERDVLAAYRADYGAGVHLHWWERLRAGVGLFFVVTLLGAGLTLLVGMFFVGLTILIETLV